MRFMFVVWIEMSSQLLFGTDVHGPLRMSCNHFGDPLTFHIY